jgi:hypothetical protein
MKCPICRDESVSSSKVLGVAGGECPVCKEEFNRGENQPYKLVPCDHVSCRSCLKRMSQGRLHEGDAVMALQARGVESEQDRELREREENRQKLQAEREAAEARRQEAGARQERALAEPGDDQLFRAIEANPRGADAAGKRITGKQLQQYLARKTGYDVRNFRNSARYRNAEALAAEVDAIREQGVKARISNTKLYSPNYAPK